MTKIKLWQWALIQIALVWGVCFGFIFKNINAALNITITILFLHGLVWMIFGHLIKKAIATKDRIAEQGWLFGESVLYITFTIIAVPFISLWFMELQLGPWFIGFALSLLVFFLILVIPLNNYINRYYGWQATLEKILKLHEKNGITEEMQAIYDFAREHIHEADRDPERERRQLSLKPNDQSRPNHPFNRS